MVILGYSFLDRIWWAGIDNTTTSSSSFSFVSRGFSMFLGIFYLVSYMGVVGVDAGQGVGPTWSETPTWTVLASNLRQKRERRTFAQVLID